MVRYTTPTFTLTFPEGTSFRDASDVYFSATQGWRKLVKKLSDGGLSISDNTISVYLTQEESGMFQQNIALEPLVTH